MGWFEERAGLDGAQAQRLGVLETLSDYLVEIKRSYPDKEDASVLVEPDIPYDHLIQVMDVVRNTRLPAEEEGGKHCNDESLPRLIGGEESEQECQLHVAESESASSDQREHEQEEEVDDATGKWTHERAILDDGSAQEQHQSDNRAGEQDSVRDEFGVDIGQRERHGDCHEPQVGREYPVNTNRQRCDGEQQRRDDGNGGSSPGIMPNGRERAVGCDALSDHSDEETNNCQCERDHWAESLSASGSRVAHTTHTAPGHTQPDAPGNSCT